MERAARDITVINAAPVSTSLFDARHNAKYVISLRQRGVDKECKRVKNRDPAAAVVKEKRSSLAADRRFGLMGERRDRNGADCGRQAGVLGPNPGYPGCASPHRALIVFILCSIRSRDGRR
jgi:hypothetical protein